MDSLSIPEGHEWDQERINDLCYDQGEIPHDLAQKVMRDVAAEIQADAIAEQLAPHLQKRGVISCPQYQMLVNKGDTDQEKSQKLLVTLNTASFARDASKIVSGLYLALLDSFEADVGMGDHHRLAIKVLRLSVLDALGIDAKSQERKEKDIATVVARVKPTHILQQESALQLRQSLALGNTGQCSDEVTVRQVCQEWYHMQSRSCTLAELVQALIFTRGVGRLVSRLVPLCFSNPPEVHVFVRNLREQWKVFASYLGYTEEEILTIEDRSRYNLRVQIRNFLRVWCMPDCGKRTIAILENVKKSAGIMDNDWYRGDLADDPMKVLPATDRRAAAIQTIPVNVVNVYQTYYSIPGSQQQGGAGVASIPGQHGATPGIPVPPYHAIAAPQQFPQHQSWQTDWSAMNHSQSVETQFVPQQGVQPVSAFTHPQQQVKCTPETMTAETESSTLSVSKVHDVMAQNDGMSLLTACTGSEWDMAEALVNSHSYLEARSQDGKTPLMYACIKGNTKFAKLLISNGADPSALDSCGFCCLHFPQTLRNQGLFTYLIEVYKERGVSVDLAAVDNNYTPLMVACTLGDVAAYAAKLLLDSGAAPNGEQKANCRPLVEASGRGYIKLVELLLTYGANPDIQDMNGYTALLQACKCSQLDIISLLLENGASVNRSDHNGTTPLFSAVEANSYPVVQQLIVKGAHVNATRYMTNPMCTGTVEETPLSHACARGFQRIAEHLIQCGANVNYLCSGTVPPIGFAIIGNQVHMVQFLLKNNDFDRSIHGLSGPIIIAVKVENIHCAKLLLTELGGPEKALQKAQEKQLHQLSEHIDMFMEMNKAFPPTSAEENPDPIQERLQSSDNYKVDGILQRLCQICVSAIVNNTKIPCEELIATAKAVGNADVANFLNRCCNNSQKQDSLRRDFLSGDPSPALYLIQNGILTAEDFQIHALQFYEDGAEKFYEELVWAFHQLPGSESLPYDPQCVLQRFFSGQFGVGVHIGILGNGRATYPNEIPLTCKPPVRTVRPPSPPKSNHVGEAAYTPMINGVPIARKLPDSTMKQRVHHGKQHKGTLMDHDGRPEVTSTASLKNKKPVKNTGLDSLEMDGPISGCGIPRPVGGTDANSLLCSPQCDLDHLETSLRDTFPSTSTTPKESSRASTPGPNLTESKPWFARPALRNRDQQFQFRQIGVHTHESQPALQAFRLPSSQQQSLSKQNVLSKDSGLSSHSLSSDSEHSVHLRAHSPDAYFHHDRTDTKSSATTPDHGAFNVNSTLNYGRCDSGYGGSRHHSFDEQSVIDVDAEEVKALLRHIAVTVDNWEDLAHNLPVDEEAIAYCKRTYSFRQEQCLQMLVKWIRSQRSQATYAKLMKALSTMHREDLCQFTVNHFTKPQALPPPLPRTTRVPDHYLSSTVQPTPHCIQVSPDILERIYSGHLSMTIHLTSGLAQQDSTKPGPQLPTASAPQQTNGFSATSDTTSLQHMMLQMMLKMMEQNR